MSAAEEECKCCSFAPGVVLESRFLLPSPSGLIKLIFELEHLCCEQSSPVRFSGNFAQSEKPETDPFISVSSACVVIARKPM